MKGRPIDQLVFEQMFPKPRTQDPQNFHALLQRHLILEVRQEVHSFYGHLDTPEAKYPGLDYNNRIHRIRLSRWQWHRRLFRAFDALRLTPNEISGLTKWEGTKWAKERYEKENNCEIIDTAADGMPVWDPQNQDTRRHTHVAFHTEHDAPLTAGESMIEDDYEDSEAEWESVGVSLNQRLQERVAARAAGDSSLPLDEAWEQWFKNAVETGEIGSVRDSLRERRRMMANARAGHWEEIPEALQDMVRDMLNAEEDLLRGRSSLSSHPSHPQLGILSLPPSSVSHAAHTSAPRSSRPGLRIPVAFQGVSDNSSSHVQRTNA